MADSVQQAATPPAAAASSPVAPASAPASVPAATTAQTQQPIALTGQLPLRAPPAAPEPHWTAYWSAFVIPVMAAIAAYIAYQNMRASKHKIKVDLFEKRHAIMKRLDAVIDSTLTVKEFVDEDTPDDYLTYVDIAKEARWLFDVKVMNWMYEYVERGIQRYVEADESYDMATSPEEATERREKAKECRGQLIRSQHNMLDVFAPYLTLHKE